MNSRDGVVISLETGGSSDTYGHTAAAKDVLSLLGNRWVATIVVSLRSGPLRHGVLKKRMKGVSQRMLTLTLRGLERDGIVERTAYPGSPPCVIYELTTLGRSLQAIIEAVGDWADGNILAIEAARSRFDERGQGSAAQQTTGRVHRIA